jgi:two-component system, OmpR family, sensor histidine kinase KdpD
LSSNFFFFPPVGTFTIADPQNWVALFSFLATSLIASRLSAMAKRQALEATERQQDVERLYTFSRAILLIGRTDSFPAKLLENLVKIFKVTTAVLYELRTGKFYRFGSAACEGLDDRLRSAALQESSVSEAQANSIVIPIRLSSEPIASLALQGASMPNSVLQGIANLVAVGLERARAQDLAEQVEAARQSEQLRTTLIDAMAHEFKTPLTLIKAASTSILASPDGLTESQKEQLTIADEEAEHLRELIDNAVEMARLDTTHIEIHPEPSNLREVIHEVIASMQSEIEGRALDFACEKQIPVMTFDRRLIKLAIKQLLDNALKYSSAGTPVTICVRADEVVTLEITDRGAGIPIEEQERIFERFYRSPSIKDQIPGSGLGLSIAHSIAQAHNGELAVTSQPGETVFRLTLPQFQSGETN